ncbi:hypothetical protein BASA60_003703 [Batrachochytrium salamandrivorans]|nr:hypothetical protein BASA60_003703 [Batrachochytrium salamandrivorans]
MDSPGYGKNIDSLAGKMKAQLQKAQLAENLPGLVQPAPTRWGSLKACFESLRKSEHVLHRIVSARDFIQGTGKQKESQQKINDIITDGKFVENLDKAIMILNPVDTTIVVFQSDSVPVSQIYQSFANTMKEQYEMMNCLSDAERLYLLQLLQSRLDFLYGDAIGIAYLLDPRFVGEKMTAFERTRVEDLIFDYGSETEQAQQMGKKERNVSPVHQFCDQGQSQQGSKGFSLPDVGKGNQDYPAVLVGRRS